MAEFSSPKKFIDRVIRAKRHERPFAVYTSMTRSVFATVSFPKIRDIRTRPNIVFSALESQDALILIQKIEC